MPSLTPAATHRLWERLVHARDAHPRTSAAAADCRPARVVFYAQTDWLRLATKLAQTASPCAQYYISVPPLASDKTALRAGQAAQIRALGPNFHALAEMSWNGWNAWIANHGSNWAQAGITARQRMAAAGFDVTRGDTWAINELSSAVRRNTGTTRQNIRDFVRGLYTGDGTQPAAKGVAFVVGIDQSSSPLGPYQAVLQAWDQDAGFWGDMSAYVSDWGQEAYGDVRDYAVAGATPQQRRDALEQYLGHPLALVNAGPAAAATARGFLDSAYLPLGNAAWAWGSAYGWTSVPFAQMQDYVSAQVYAARALASATGAGVDRIGFAWAPSNSTGLSSGDYTSQTAQILDRLGAAIRDSAETADPGDPGIGACGPAGQPSWCSTVVANAFFPTAWQAFSTWAQSSVAFASPPATIAAGTPSGPLTLQLQTAGAAGTAASPVTLALTSSSPHGQFATSPTGPWSPTLSVTVPAGAGSASVFYEDTTAGTPTLTATADGTPAATQTETVTAGPLAKITVSPSATRVLEGRLIGLTATGLDGYGNAVSVTPTWSLLPGTLGRLRAAGAAATFVAGSRPARGTITATSGAVSATAAVTVTAPPPRLKSVRVRMSGGHLLVTATVVAGKSPARGVRLTLRVRHGSSTVARVTGRTGRHGTLVWRSRGRLPKAHYVVKATLR